MSQRLSACVYGRQCKPELVLVSACGSVSGRACAGVRAVIGGPGPASPGLPSCALLQGLRPLPHWGGRSPGASAGLPPRRCEQPLNREKGPHSLPATSRGSGARWDGKGPRESSFRDTSNLLAWNLRWETRSLAHSPPNHCGALGGPRGSQETLRSARSGFRNAFLHRQERQILATNKSCTTLLVTVKACHSCPPSLLQPRRNPPPCTRDPPALSSLSQRMALLEVVLILFFGGSAYRQRPGRLTQSTPSQLQVRALALPGSAKPFTLLFPDPEALAQDATTRVLTPRETQACVPIP